MTWGAIAVGHLHVEQGDVRPVGANGGERLGAGGGRGDHLQVDSMPSSAATAPRGELLVVGEHE